MVRAAVSGGAAVMTSSSSEILGGATARGALSWGIKTASAVAALTAARLAWLAVQPADLYPDEAQYWVWAQHLALGYYSKPPLVAWLIALTTGLAGDSELAIRLAAPLLHAAAAGFVYAIGARLYDRRVGFWSALAYASLPGVSLSAFLISTDAVLLPCWAAALYGFVRAREEGGRWWGFVGVAVGLGLLAKFAMGYWLVSAFAGVLILRDERRHWRGLLAAAAIALLFYLPNLWWNWQHGFVSYLHVRDNAALGRELVHPAGLVRFVASQLGVFGPIFFLALVALCARPAMLAAPAARLLLVFTLPSLVLMLGLSFLSHAEPNWAAPAYVAATVLVTAILLARDWRRLLAGSIALNLVAVLLLFAGGDALAAAGIAVPAKYDPLHRLRSWRGLGETVAAALAAHPGLTLLADDREVLAALTYYVHPHPFDAVEWSPIPGVANQWALANSLSRHEGEDFLAVTIHGLAHEMRPHFAELTELSTIATTTGPGGGRQYTLYIARGYRSAPKPGG
jgi:4-amino-4-deoxy-L-arabinose transferase-like glycosyltransferase